MIKKYFKSEFLRNAFTLASGTTIAQIFAVLCTPITYRIYDKQDYGTLAQYMSVIMVVGVFSTLQYNQAILLEKEEERVKDILTFNQLVNITIAILVAILITLFGDYLSELFKNPSIKPWLYLVPISILFKGQNELLKVWANRTKKYKILSFNSILIASVVPIVSISLGLLFDGKIFGLFIGFLSGQIIPPIVMAIRLGIHKNINVQTLKLSNLKSIAKEYSSLPKYSLPAEFLNIFASQLPVFLLSTFANTATVGLYNLAARILNMPIQVVSSAIGNVFRQQATKVYNETGTCKEVFVKTFKLLFLLAIVPYSIILFMGEDIFALVFGEKWKMAGHFAQFLIILYFFKFITGPLSYMYFIANKLKEDLLIRIPMIATMSAALYFGLQYSIEIGLLSFALIRGFFYILILFRSYAFSKTQKL